MFAGTPPHKSRGDRAYVYAQLPVTTSYTTLLDSTLLSSHVWRDSGTGETVVPPSLDNCVGVVVTGIQPQLWVDRAASAVAFYQEAFGATVMHSVGDGEEIVAQLAVEESAFWVATMGSVPGRLEPHSAGGSTGRTLLLVEDPDAAVARAVGAGAELSSPVDEEHNWRLGRIVDPFGHEWEIGRPSGPWPPTEAPT